MDAGDRDSIVRRGGRGWTRGADSSVDGGRQEGHVHEPRVPSTADPATGFGGPAVPRGARKEPALPTPRLRTPASSTRGKRLPAVPRHTKSRHPSKKAKDPGRRRGSVGSLVTFWVPAMPRADRTRRG